MPKVLSIGSFFFNITVQYYYIAFKHERVIRVQIRIPMLLESGDTAAIAGRAVAMKPLEFAVLYFL